MSSQSIQSLLEGTRGLEPGKQEAKPEKVIKAKRRWGLLPSGLYGWTTRKKQAELEMDGQTFSHKKEKSSLAENTLTRWLGEKSKIMPGISEDALTEKYSNFNNTYKRKNLEDHGNYRNLLRHSESELWGHNGSRGSTVGK